MSNFMIVPYSDRYEKEWDDFVNNKAFNGTFLQTRNFLNYHPKNRFDDCSLMVYDEKDHLVSVCPGCQVLLDGKKTFYSHKGATFGGFVLSARVYKSKYLLSILNIFEDYLRTEGFDSVYMKITPDIFSEKRPALLEYALYHQGFAEHKELNPFIDYSSYELNELSAFSQGKRTHVHKCERKGMEVRTIDEDAEVVRYYGILCENLSKYGLTPVHTLDELIEFKNTRLKKECEFFGVYLSGDMVAGGMMFYFHKAKTAHTQYLSAKSAYLKLSPATYLYYWIIVEMRKRGFRHLSWGICTEDHGKYLNEGLINSKEDFGSTYSNNLAFYKVFL